MFKYLDILPNPNYGVTDSGDSGGSLGQPFSDVSLSFEMEHVEDVTQSGVAARRTQRYPLWNAKIKYNPMTKEQFNPVWNFLMTKAPGRSAFWVPLPQYRLPKNAAFATYVQTSPSITITGNPTAGSMNFEISAPAWSSNSYTSGVPRPGDMFNIKDDLDTLHTKMYMVTRVETYNDYQTGNRPASGSIRVHCSPGLQKKIQTGATIEFFEPKLRSVMAKNVTAYSLNSEGLYEFQLDLQEALY